MLTPVQSVSFGFTSDGESTVMLVDLSTLPNGLDFRGAQPNGTAKIALSASSGPAPTQTVTISMQGSVATITLSAPLPEFDLSSNLIVYTLAFLLTLTPLQPPPS